MPFFSRILNFKRDFLARLRDHRRQTRYHVGAGFTLKASVSLIGSDALPAKGANPGGPGCDWAGRVSDLSAGGLSVLLPPAAATVRGEATSVRLTLESRELTFLCTVAHFRGQHAQSICGLKLEFGDFKEQKAYQQIVEAVSLGASFAPVDGNRAPRASLGLARRQWRSLKQARLTEWRETGTKKLDRFELILEEHKVEGRAAEGTFEILTAQGKAVPPTVAAEVRQLFLWVVANLPGTVPADLRDYMTRAATVRATPQAKTSRGSMPPVASTPPSEWAPPKRGTRSPV